MDYISRNIITLKKQKKKIIGNTESYERVESLCHGRVYLSEGKMQLNIFGLKSARNFCVKKWVDWRD